MKLISLQDLPQKSVSHNPEITKKVMVKFGDFPPLTNFSQACLAPQQVAKAHAHKDMLEVFFVETGSGVMEINHKQYPLQPGSCIVVEPEEVHSLINNSMTDLIVTYFGIQIHSLSS